MGIDDIVFSKLTIVLVERKPYSLDTAEIILQCSIKFKMVLDNSVY